MATSRRHQVRLSYLALLLSFLRDGVVDTSNFQNYPRVGNDWSFPFNSKLYQIRANESGHPAVPMGITIQFVEDVADPIRHSVQTWKINGLVFVRSPMALVGDHDANLIAEQIDEAMTQAYGGCQIWDYDQNPAVQMLGRLEWHTYSRGMWRDQPNFKQSLPVRGWTTGEQTTLFQTVMNFEASYSTPNL
jgi:hypothetical protein